MLDRGCRAFWAVTVRTAQSALGGLLAKRGSLVLPLAGSAAHREGCPNRFGRGFGYPWATIQVCEEQHREGSAGRLDAGALRQHLALDWKQNIAARTPRSALEPSPSLGDLLFPARRAPPARPALDRW